jgi:hypothetical protein
VWRKRAEQRSRAVAVGVALALTVFLSMLGIAGGQSPPRAIALGNLLGGVALAAVFAWLLARDRAARPAILWPLATLIGIQLALGAWLAIVDRNGAALPAHALLAMPLAAFLGWFALARLRGASGGLLFCLALLAPLAGFTALQYEHSALAALVHALTAVSLVGAAALVAARGV